MLIFYSSKSWSRLQYDYRLAKNKSKLNIESGIPLDQNWQQQFWVELTRFILSQEPKCYTWVLPQELQFLMYLISLDR